MSTIMLPRANALIGMSGYAYSLLAQCLGLHDASAVVANLIALGCFKS